jgi:hypothetical protein
MSRLRKNEGFSLTEVLLAVGTLGLGMLFVAGVFPVAHYFATVASERTITAVAADEAFAKIRLYGGYDRRWVARLFPNDCNDFSSLVPMPINPVEFAYPSDPNVDPALKQYYWSALCRLTEPHIIRGDPNDPIRTVQVTVFVCRKVGASTTYHGWAGNWPVPVKVGVEYVDVAPLIRKNRLRIIPHPPAISGDKTFINDGSTIVDNLSGKIYRVLERDAIVDNEIVLDRDWDGPRTPFIVWVVPPPIGGGRKPCIAVYQKVIRF